MRWIFRYNEQAAKYIGKILHKKMPETQPWLHIAVKTFSQRNPWSGYVIYIWDTRKVVAEYRSNKGLFKTEDFVISKSGMTRAIDNRQPLVGGRNDVNEFFEFGDFDASHSDIFEGKDRVKETPLYKRRAAKLPKPGQESNELDDCLDNGGQVDLSKYEVQWYKGDDDKLFAIIEGPEMLYMCDSEGNVIDCDFDLDELVNAYHLQPAKPGEELFHNPRKAGSANTQPFKYLFGVYRYDEECAKICRSNIETQPWLHCAVIIERQDNGKYIYAYMIYVWDQRKVLYKQQNMITEDQANELKKQFRSMDLMQARDTLANVEGQPSGFDNYMTRSHTQS